MPIKVDEPIQRQIRLLAKEYSALFSGLSKFLIRYRPSICPFDAIISNVPLAKSVFDIGSGSGFLLFAMARLREINQLCGVDAGQAILSKARLALTSAVPAANVDLICAASSQSWPDSRFDVVTMIDVLHHIPVSQQKDFVIEAAARVAPGGILIYKDMARNPLFYALANRMHDLVLAQQWIHYAPFEEVVQTLTTAGLTETRRAGTKLFWYAHEMVVMRRE